MDKKDKILILVAPVALAVGGWLMFGKGGKNVSEQRLSADDFTQIAAPASDEKKSKTELYRDKYEQEHGEVYKRKIESDESFFADEIMTDTAAGTQELGAGVLGVPRGAESVTGDAWGKEQGGQGPGSRGNDVRKGGNKGKKDEPKSEVGRRVVVDTVKVVTEVVSKRRRRTGFYGDEVKGGASGNDDGNKINESVAIECVVQEDVEAKQGSNISIRTTAESIINGVKVPKNTLITGVVNIGSERLSILVSTIKGETRNIAVKMKAYDLEGNEGIPVEGGVDKEIKKDAVNEALAEARTAVKVPIISGLSTKLGSKKVNDPTVPIGKGYKLVLKPHHSTGG